MSKLITDLDPRMQKGVNLYVSMCNGVGIPTVVLETRRDLATQMAYYARGRAPELAKEYYARLGLWALSDSEANTQNTKTLYSKHIDGLAVDIAPTKDGKPWWDAPLDVWLKMFTMAETECGLDACAAGKWNSWQWDWPHHEFKWEI